MKDCYGLAQGECTMIVALATARRRQERIPLRCAVALTLLALPAAAANAQTPCDGATWAVQNDGNYHFSYANRQQAGTIAFCVRNHDGHRAVFVDWQGAGLRSAVPPGRTIFRTSLRGARPATPRLFPFFYGARPNQIDVPTLVAQGAVPPRFTPTAPLLFRRAAFSWMPDETTAAPRPGGNSSLVYIPHPAMVAVLAAVDGIASVLAGGGGSISRIEDHPELLVAFASTFDESVTANSRGRVAITYEFRYYYGFEKPQLRRRLPSRPPTGNRRGWLYLRFSDPVLHRLMFRRDDEVPLRGAGRETLLRATASAPGSGSVTVRTAVLELLLNDRRSVIASIPVTYSSPAS
jgi:hypothetical protein